MLVQLHLDYTLLDLPPQVADKANQGELALRAAVSQWLANQWPGLPLSWELVHKGRKVCPQCQRVFLPASAKRVYCEPACQAAAWRDRNKQDAQQPPE